MWLVCSGCSERKLVAKSWGTDWQLWDDLPVLQQFLDEHFWCVRSPSQLAQGSHLRIKYDHEDSTHHEPPETDQP
jgi:hypothetical protein